MSISGWVIAVCAKIEDGGRRHLGFFCLMFWHICICHRHLEFIIFVDFGPTVHFQCQPTTLLQNFICLCQLATELLLFMQKSKMAVTAILNYNYVMLDHPRSPFLHLKFPFKFCVDRVHTFWDITIQKFCKFGLKCLFRAPKSCFWGVLTPNIIFYHRDPQKALPYVETSFEPSVVVIGLLVWPVGVSKNSKKGKNTKMHSIRRAFPVVSRQSNFACEVLSRISSLILSFIKICWKIWELSGGSKFWPLHWLGTSLMQHLVATAKAVIMTSQRDVINETTVSDVQYWSYNFIIFLVFNCHCVLTEKNSPGIYWTILVWGGSLRSGFSISNQIKFDLRFTDLRLTWCSELIVDQLCFVFPRIFDLQLRGRRLVDRPSTEPTLCQSDWLTVTSICSVVLMGMRCEWTL